MQDEGLVTKEDRLPWTANPAASEGNSMHSESFMGGVQGVGYEYNLCGKGLKRSCYYDVFVGVEHNDKKDGD